MNTKKKVLFGILLSMLLICCDQKSKKIEIRFDKKAQILTSNYSKSIFNKDVINSTEILDKLEKISDTIFIDTAKYFRTPKATIYANRKARTHFQVFENPKGTITVIAFFKNKTSINVAEYYKNGQVMCKFDVKDDGIRNGNYFCFFEDGNYRIKGYYKNGKEINDSLKTYNQK